MSLSDKAEKQLLELWVEKYKWLKLHTGDPGEACTSNTAAETTRKSVTWGTPEEGAGKVVTTSEAKWEEVGSAETYKYVSFWDAETNGNAGGSGALETERTVAIGDTFIIKSGKWSVTLS